ncbi:hypothetical protein [Streptomyces violaceus]|uniref:Uncharacterized protein n=1 Tax=Streptomyces violaceus TaxID=1936 RepID=A0ABY9UL26_STRVL|nr:hypothetical protein [Streptomyces janthinus]WND23560.1 hypothetical protein RI060_42340 [Streptomyces janthinus]
MQGAGSPTPGLLPAGCAPPRYFWQAYSPELTRSITADVLRDALTGYRDLVELNFPRFGAALGLYSTFPVRAEGVVAMPAGESQPATVMYALRPYASSAPHYQPVVDLSRSDEPHLPAGAFWANLRQDRSSAFRRPASSTRRHCSPTMSARPRTSRTAGSPRTCTQSACWSAR